MRKRIKKQSPLGKFRRSLLFLQYRWVQRWESKNKSLRWAKVIQFYFYCFFLYFFASVFPSTFIVPDLLLSLVLFFFFSFCFAPNKTILSLLNCLFMFYVCLLCTQIPVCWLPGFLIASHFAEKKEKKNTQLLIASTCQDTMLCPLRALPLHSTARSVLPPAKNSNSIKISIYFHARHATLRSSFFPRSSPGKRCRTVVVSSN